MRIIALALWLIVLFTAASFAQTSETPPPPPVAVDDVVKISTSLIQINATVTDKKGNAVGNLKPEDFEIYQNGKRQKITNVTFVGVGKNSVQPENSAKPEKNADKKIPIPVISETKSEQVRRTIALVVDDFHLSGFSTYYAQKALKKFVDEQMQNGDLVAIVRVGGGIGSLQQFTSDKRLLYAAIEKVRWHPPFGGLGAGATPFVPVEQTDENGLGASDLENGQISSERRAQTIAIERRANQSAKDFTQNNSASDTINSLGFIIRGMRELPGRKSVIMMSDGFQLFSAATNENNYNAEKDAQLKKLADVANRSSVVVYTMDARGVQPTGPTAADDVPGDRTGSNFSSVIRNRINELFSTQEALIAIAERTGGLAILNNNDFSDGFRQVLNDQSYYQIAYQPDEDIFDPSKLDFNNLEIKVNRDNTKVRYSSGFFGIADETIEKPTIQTPYQQMAAILISPFSANDITLNLNTVFRSDAKYGYFINSFLYISIKDLKFTEEPNGMKKSVFDLLAVTFGDNGVPVDAISKTYTINLKTENYQKLLSEGFIYNFTFPVKNSGAYQMRVAIRDHATEKLGSASQFIEVPKLDKKRLTLSGIVVENLSRELYENASLSNSKLKNPDTVADTALRNFKRGTVLRYGFEIYNAKSSNLKIKTRVYHEGKLVFEGKPKPVETNGQINSKTIATGGAVSIGDEMEIGDYILQIIITDDLAKDKYDTATQFVQFEVVR